MHIKKERNKNLAPTMMANTSTVTLTNPEPKPATRPNLRHHQRIAARLDAVIGVADGSLLKCQLKNLSRAGAMIMCSPETVNSLLPKGTMVSPKHAVRVQVQFELSMTDIPPTGGVQRVLITAYCNIVYQRRVSRDTFHLGMSFTALGGNGQEYIDQYIDRKLHPSP